MFWEEQILENFKNQLANAKNELLEYSAELIKTPFSIRSVKILVSSNESSSTLSNVPSSSSTSSSVSLSISDGLSNYAKQNNYKGPSPPSSEDSDSNLISTSKISYNSSSTSATNDNTRAVNAKEWELYCKAINFDTNHNYCSKEKISFIEKTDAALGIDALKIEKENIFMEILLMLGKVKITKNLEEIKENLEMHMDIYNSYHEHIKNLSIEN